MKKLILLFLMGHAIILAHAQQYVIDPQVFASVTANAAVRSSAELTHQQYLGKINANLDNINVNMGAVVLAQQMIYNGLANVNSALRNGLAVKNLAVIVSDITNYTMQALELVKSDPALLLFTSRIGGQMKSRCLELMNDVSSVILKEGDNVLADYNARDQLLKMVTQQLQVVDGLAYGAWRAMFWAKEKGVIAALNPFAGFVTKDKIYVQQIISNAKYLRQ